MMYQSVPEMEMDEYAPQMIPAISGRANSLMDVTPMIYRTHILINVVRDVLMLRVSV